jgi:hypothetical protein
MSAADVLIFFAIIGSVICARARVAGGAVVFAVIATVLFVGTPVGSGLPGAVASLVSTIGQASQPLTGTTRADG